MGFQPAVLRNCPDSVSLLAFYRTESFVIRSRENSAKLGLKSKICLSLYLNTQYEKCMYMLAGFYVEPEPIANVHACCRKISWTLNRVSLIAGTRLAITASVNMTKALAK